MRTQPLNHLDRHYMQWRDENENVFDLFRQFAKPLAEKRKCFGIALLAERVRWERHFNYDGEDFKIDNNYKAYIIRDLIEEIPELDGLVQLRAVAGEYDPAD